MPRSSRSSETSDAGERGSASLEFLTAGIILLVPLVYLVLAVAAIQAAAFGVEGAARQAARIAAQRTATDSGGPAGAVDRAVRVALADYGVDVGSATVTLSCSGDCTEPGTRVTARVRATVALPLVPEVLAATPMASVPLEASATQTVSRFAGGAP